MPCECYCDCPKPPEEDDDHISRCPINTCKGADCNRKLEDICDCEECPNQDCYCTCHDTCEDCGRYCHNLVCRCDCHEDESSEDESEEDESDDESESEEDESEDESESEEEEEEEEEKVVLAPTIHEKVVVAKTYPTIQEEKDPLDQIKQILSSSRSSEEKIHEMKKILNLPP